MIDRQPAALTRARDRSKAVLKRYGGTLSQFTGDGIIAVFGAPITLEDHAVRACLAALGVQGEAKRLAAGVEDRDGIDLRLRVGLNSGRVIAGEMGSGPFGYTAVGEQVGMAQRMESVAPPGGAMLSDSTARLVEHAAVLGEPELVTIKGSDEPVTAHGLLGVAADQESTGRIDTRPTPTLHRLGRSVREVATVLHELSSRGVYVRSLREGVDTSTPTGRAATSIMATIAELELELGKERRAA